MNKKLYELVINRLLSEFSSMGAGSVGGVSTPLGTGPKAGSKGENIYKSSTSTDKKHRSKKKKSAKKKPKVKSVQWYLKHGPAKSNKRSLKESLNYLFEARTPQIEDLSKDSLIALLNHFISHATEEYQIDITEKFAGQHLSVCIHRPVGSSKNVVYFANKDQFDLAKKNLVDKGLTPSEIEVMLSNKKFITNMGIKRGERVRSSFESPHKFNLLPEGESKYFGIEILKPDREKPDYVGYNIRRKEMKAIIYKGDITSEEAAKLDSYRNKIRFMSPHDAKRSPIAKEKLASAIIKEIESMIDEIRNVQKYTKSYVAKNIKPRIKELIEDIFGYSLLGRNSPFEGLFVNLKSNEQNIGFKIPDPRYSSLQSIQAPLYSEFSSKGRSRRENQNLNQSKIINITNKINNFLLDIEQETNSSRQVRRGSVTYNIIKFVSTLNDKRLVKNLRVFFSPEEFNELCRLAVNVFKHKDSTQINNLVTLVTINISDFDKWHTIKSQDNYNNQYIVELKEIFNEINSIIDNKK